MHFNSLSLGRCGTNFKSVILEVIVQNSCLGACCEIAFNWMPQDLTDDKSTLVQVMAWCRQATSHYLGQCWPRSLPPYGVTRPQWVNSLICVSSHKVYAFQLFKNYFQLFMWYHDKTFTSVNINLNICFISLVISTFYRRIKIENKEHVFVLDIRIDNKEFAFVSSRYMLDILPITDWSNESIRPALNLIFRRLERCFTKIYKKYTLKVRWFVI